MTLDEAIAHAREVAEEKYRDASMYADDNGLYAKEYAECRFCAEEHEQLAEWLEELKQLRAEIAEMHDERQAECAFKKEHDEQIRVDAIDEYKQKILNHLKKYYSSVDRAISEDELKIEDIKIGYMDAIELIEDIKEKKNES